MSVITREEELKKILTHKNNYSFDKLRKHFSFNNDFLLMDFLIDYLDNSIKDFNFETNYSKNKYLYKFIKYFNYNLSRIDLDNEYNNGISEVVNGMSSIYDSIMLKKKEFNETTMSNNCYDNLELLNKISQGILLSINNIKEKLLCQGISILNIENDLNDITKKIIRKFKNNEYLRVMISSYPELIYLKDVNNYLFSDLVDNYFNILLNKNNNSEKIYYDKIMDLYLKPDNADDKEIIKDIFFIKTEKFLKKIESMDIDSNKMDYIMSAIKERIHQTKVDEIDFLTDKSNQDYYKSINFDILGPLIGTKEHINRSNFTFRYVITIDNDQANVLENAISIHKKGEKYLLSIYTPDVVDAISQNRDFEKNQYNKALNKPPKRRIFNSSISKEKFSLDEGKISNVFAYQFLIDKDFKSNNFDITKDCEFDMFVDKLYKVLKNEVINTIGNDGIYEEDNLSMSLFSPLRKISSLVNQMLTCIYFVNNNTELDFSTRNYLETRLDKICNNINDINRYTIKNEKEYVIVKKMEDNNE